MQAEEVLPVELVGGPRDGEMTTAFPMHRPGPMWPPFLTGQIEKPLRVLAVCEPGYLRSTVMPELMADRRMSLVGEASTVRDARRLAMLQEFDVLLVELTLPDGSALELIPYAKRLRPRAEAIVISSSEDGALAQRAFACGAAGFLVKNSCFDSVVQSVLQVANGGACITPTLARRLLVTRTAEGGHAAVPAELPAKLSERELEILRLVANGMTSCEVARRLAISELTVNTHLKHAYRKLQARTRAQAVCRANSMGIL